MPSNLVYMRRSTSEKRNYNVNCDVTDFHDFPDFITITSFVIKQIIEKIVTKESSEKRPLNANVRMKLLIPTKRAMLNAMDIRTFSRLLDRGKKTATNAYPGKKRQKGKMKSEGVEIPRIRKTNIAAEYKSRKNIHNRLYILPNERIDIPILCIVVPH